MTEAGVRMCACERGMRAEGWTRARACAVRHRDAPPPPPPPPHLLREVGLLALGLDALLEGAGVGQDAGDLALHGRRDVKGGPAGGEVVGVELGHVGGVAVEGGAQQSLELGPLRLADGADEVVDAAGLLGALARLLVLGLEELLVEGALERGLVEVLCRELGEVDLGLARLGEEGLHALLLELALDLLELGRLALVLLLGEALALLALPRVPLRRAIVLLLRVAGGVRGGDGGGGEAG